MSETPTDDDGLGTVEGNLGGLQLSREAAEQAAARTARQRHSPGPSPTSRPTPARATSDGHGARVNLLGTRMHQRPPPLRCGA